MRVIKSAEIGRMIRNARSTMNLDVRTCATQLGIGAIRLNDFERGNRIPSKEEFQIISKFFNWDFELDNYAIPPTEPTRASSRVHVDFEPGTPEDEKKSFFAMLDSLNT